ncbi:hypothetical protein BT67DRAFT_445586 [Trichocladium antarcticum]|uniref:Uncharacterized protein n=1 Tax=Trichocladium antarcticum TaxID=1450529 RepID=A0AAN6UCK9_9PEZI|nr:hypothetical protein BT67DRAFT_445586 [Trichocladium antarcticum]
MTLVFLVAIVGRILARLATKAHQGLGLPSGRSAPHHHHLMGPAAPAIGFLSASSPGQPKDRQGDSRQMRTL